MNHTPTGPEGPVRALYVDFDDFHEGNHRLEILDDLRARIPEFRCTLFTVPGLCSKSWLWNIANTRAWLDLVPHGWMHPTPRECQHWDRARVEQYFFFELMGYPFELRRGFKAPGWQISDATYQVCHENGFWVADQEYNRERRPHGLKVYELGPDSIHGHIGHMGGHNANEIDYLYEEIVAAAVGGARFDFVRRKVQPWQPSIS
jgi:hypothetical protein